MQCDKCLKYMSKSSQASHDCVPVTVRREYVWVPEDPTRRSRGLVEGAGFIEVKPGIKEIYTLIDQEKREFYKDPASPPPMDPMSIVLKHDVSMLSEAHGHDWMMRGPTSFHYMSRYVAGNVWILVEYHDT